MEPGGAAEKWRNHGHGRYFLAICTLFVTGLLRGPLLIAAIGLTVTALVRRGKFQGLAVVSLVICAYSLFSMIQLAIFLGAAGTAGGGFAQGGWDARKEEVSEEERPREEEARGENEETEMEETTEAERNPGGAYFASGNSPSQTAAVLGTNENDVTVSGEISVIFYDEAGQMLSLGNMYINNCPLEERFTMEFTFPETGMDRTCPTITMKLICRWRNGRKCPDTSIWGTSW